MNYELCKKLKEARFPFKEHDDDHVNEIYGGLSYYATLSELIEACGEKFKSLNKIKQKKNWWAAGSGNGLSVHGSTPEEAVANLWLSINK